MPLPEAIVSVSETRPMILKNTAADCTTRNFVLRQSVPRRNLRIHDDFAEHLALFQILVSFTQVF